MKKTLSFILNIPWTVCGLFLGIISLPIKISLYSNPKAIIINVRNFWWYTWLPKMKGVRGMAIGNVVLLGKNILEKDLDHELIHVNQFEQEPLIHPFLYQYQNIKYGYRNNKYEKEAYEKAGNKFISN